MESPFGRRFYVMAKPAGARCNMRCGYCYYLHKHDDSPMEMSDGMLELFVRQYIEAQSKSEVLFTWHGGEPMLRGLEFYRRVLALQRHYADGLHVDNVLQTNGTLMTDEWAQFLHDNGFLVGLSLDGPRWLHDKYRGQYDRVLRAVEMLERHDVMWNAMAVVTKDSAANAREVYRFFRSIGAHYLQFSPLVYNPSCDNVEHVAPYTRSAALTAEEWGTFLCDVFDEWRENGDVGEYYVETFDATLAALVGVTPGTCCFSPTCGQVGVIEHNGDVYSCDHFVAPPYRLGNIRQTSLFQLMNSREQRAFGLRKSERLSEKCRSCEFLRLCYGECPKNRLPNGDNILCDGYRRYFRHTWDFMQEMSVKC